MLGWREWLWSTRNSPVAWSAFIREEAASIHRVRTYASFRVLGSMNVNGSTIARSPRRSECKACNVPFTSRQCTAEAPLSRRVTMHDSPASAPVSVSHIQDGGVGSGGNGVGANMQGSSGNDDGSAQAVKRAMNVKSRTHHVHPLWP